MVFKIPFHAFILRIFPDVLLITVTCRQQNGLLGSPEAFSAATNHLSCIKSFGYEQSFAIHHSAQFFTHLAALTSEG
jgi:hypothetical protein